MGVERRTIAGHSIRWDEKRAQQAYADGHWVKETLADSLQRSVSEDPERILVIDNYVRLSARELQQKARALAQTLLANFPQGSAISFMLPNWHETAIIYLGATLAGMVAHPILPSLREHELHFMLGDVDSRIIFIPAEFRGLNYVDMLSSVVQRLHNPPMVIVLRGESDGSDTPGFTRFDELLKSTAENGELPTVDPDAVRMIMYTSGTTGKPKGVMHSHNSLHALIRQIGEHWRIEPGDAFLVASPVSHIGGSIYAFECPLLLGSTAVLMEQWDPNVAVTHFLAEGCTHFAGATPFLTQLLASARNANDRLPKLKVFICGGASVPPQLILDAVDYFEQAAVSRVYGSTEVPVTTVGVISRDDVIHAAETDGKPGIAEVQLAIEQSAGADLGEILARGPQMLVGYLNPTDEDNAFDTDGFYRTGDLGRWVDGDYLLISGRAKDIIIRNGENIAPKEIEDLLLGHAAITDVAIVGLPDAKTGECACAVIVPADNAAPNVEDLRAFLSASGVAKFKIPEQVALWPSLPKNDAGKVLKHAIRARLLDPEN